MDRARLDLDPLRPPAASTVAAAGSKRLVKAGTIPLQSFYYLLVDKAISAQAWYAYDMIESLRHTAFSLGLYQYECRLPLYGGYKADIDCPQNFTVSSVHDFVTPYLQQDRILLFITASPFIDDANYPDFSYGKQWVAYHTADERGYPYAIMPWQSSTSNSVEAMQLRGGFTIEEFNAQILTHELAEATTDPIPGQGWVAADGEENADECAWSPFRNGHYASSRYYSNETKSCWPP